MRLNVSEAELGSGTEMDVAVNIDMTGVDESLGAYSAILYWDPEVLSYIGHTGGSTEGFDDPLAKVEEGRLSFNQFCVEGADGDVSILHVSFRVKGNIGEKPLALADSGLLRRRESRLRV